MRYAALTVLIALSCGNALLAETWRLQAGADWESVASDPREQYLHAISELKKLVQTGQSKPAKQALAVLKAEFPERVGPDLDLFVQGELHYWNDHYAKAVAKYEKLLKDYPGSEFADASLQREFDIARAYLGGRKKNVLGILKLSGYAEGVEIMERVSDRAGLDEPNGVGLNAAVAVAEHYESREDYLDAYLKWSEIASYWETGPVGKRAILRMAEDNLAAYNRHRPGKRPRYDASKLDTAKVYYEKFTARYGEQAAEYDIPEKIKQIDEQMAHKQFTIGQYYQRTGKRQAANLYFQMVIQNFPATEAAGKARQAVSKELNEEKKRGK